MCVFLCVTWFLFLRHLWEIPYCTLKVLIVRESKSLDRKPWKISVLQFSTIFLNFRNSQIQKLSYVIISASKKIKSEIWVHFLKKSVYLFTILVHISKLIRIIWVLHTYLVHQIRRPKLEKFFSGGMYVLPEKF